MKLIKKLPARKDKKGKSESWAEFLCEVPKCGKIVERRLSNGIIAKSCGCQKGNKKHGEKGTKLYMVWIQMKQRILNPNHKFYKDYGGRGITIYTEWLEFIPFRAWALSNGYAEGLEIHREGDGNYEPSNCRFITIEENNRNKTNTITMEIANEIRNLYSTGNYIQKELAERFNINFRIISSIINNKQWKRGN